LGKLHCHSGKFTRSWKHSTPTVENLPKVGKIPLPFEELPSNSALLNQKLEKFPLTHSGKFTKSWKNPHSQGGKLKTKQT